MNDKLSFIALYTQLGRWLQLSEYTSYPFRSYRSLLVKFWTLCVLSPLLGT